MCSAGVAVRGNFTASRNGRECGDRRERNPAGCGTVARLRSALYRECSRGALHQRDDTVVAANRHRFIGLQRTFDQRLHRGDVDFGLSSGVSVNPADVKMLLKVSPLIRVSSNVPACSPASDDQPRNRTRLKRCDWIRRVYQGDGGTGFTGTGRHCQQDVLLTVYDNLFHRADGIFTVIARIAFSSFGVFGKPLILSLRVAAQHCQRSSGDAIPAALLTLLVVCRTSRYQIPLLVFIAAVFAPVGGVAEGDFKHLFAAGVLPADFHTPARRHALRREA